MGTGKAVENDLGAGAGRRESICGCGSLLRAHRSGLSISVIVLVSISILLCISPVAAAIEAALGDTVHLAGYSYGSPYVYLFLTGPNLPANGVALDNINLPADQGGFVRVPVGSNDQWKYDWATNSVGGHLDDGSYTIWVSNEPVGLSQLLRGEYGTVSVVLRKPVLALATTSPQQGAIEIISNPDGASVTVNGQYMGQTPLTLNNMGPGTYSLTVSHFRYEPTTFVATVEPGSTTSVKISLKPSLGSLGITSNPSGARVLVDGNETGHTPISIDNLLSGNHTISLNLEGYVSVQQPVTVIAGQNSNISIDLEPAGRLKNPALTRAGTTLMLPVLLISVVVILLGIALFKHKTTRIRVPPSK